MPSRKLATRCTSCSAKNHLRARFCNECGTKLAERRPQRGTGRGKLHADIAHPINSECRAFIQEKVLQEFAAEVERAKDPHYRPSTFDDDYEDLNEQDLVDDYAEVADDKQSEEHVSPYQELIAELKADTERRRRDEGRREAPSPPRREERRPVVGKKSAARAGILATAPSDSKLESPTRETADREEDDVDAPAVEVPTAREVNEPQEPSDDFGVGII